MPTAGYLQYLQYLYCDIAKRPIRLQLRFGFYSTTTKNEHVHFLLSSRGVVANQRAEAGSSYERRKNDSMIISQLSTYISAQEVLPVAK